MRTQPITSKPELWERLLVIKRSVITTELIRNLYYSIPNRLRKVVKLGGNLTKY